MANKSLAKEPGQTTVLVTGGAGFIGSHTVVELLARGYNVVILDDLSNSNAAAVDRVAQIAGVACPGPRLNFVQASILDREAVERTFAAHNIDVIIHFAGFKAVGESVVKPLEYYWNNVAGTLVLCDVARAAGCKNIVFSSSATVYGEPDCVPITEHAAKHAPTNPYGQTKSMLEQILSDLYVGDPEWNVVLLRYFNPIGAHESGMIGEDPKGIPNNLLPYVAQVAVGKLESVGVFGDDYPTPDGTGVRDYIHVVDLARGHAAALEWMGGKCGTPAAELAAAGSAPVGYAQSAEGVTGGSAVAEGVTGAAPLDWGSKVGESAPDGTRRGVSIFNLGTGTGSSVLDVIHAFERACGKQLPYDIKPRRAGDIAENYASSAKAQRELGWQAQYDLARMCQDSWRWQSQNPNGY